MAQAIRSIASRVKPTPAALTLAASLILLFFLYQQRDLFGAPSKWTRTRNKPTLRFDQHNRFKIVQLTDLHLGEDPFTDWAPRADRRTFAVIRQILRSERPDLVVLSGDMLTGNNIDGNATAYLDRLANCLEEKDIAVPYALIFGNHDDADMEYWYPNNGTKYTVPAKTSREQLVESDQRHHHSLTRQGPADVFGVSNYMLSVYGATDGLIDTNNDDADGVKLQVVLLDSGGGSLEQQIDSSQMEWYQKQRLHHVDAVAFQHIPTEQFRVSSNNHCWGYNGERGIAPLRVDNVHEIEYLIHSDPRLHFLAVGHNHGNSYCCPAVATTANTSSTIVSNEDDDGSGSSSSSSNLHVCFGRHSGYGGYGRKYWVKGARVYEIALQEDDHSVDWRSWVRLETDFVVDQYEP